MDIGLPILFNVRGPMCMRLGQSIKYVTLFLANFNPLPLSHFVTHPGTPQKSTPHISDPPTFSRHSKKNRTKAPCTNSLNCSRGFLFGGFVRGSFVWKVLSGVVFICSPSVRVHLLRQKVKHHFKFHVSYVR